MAKAERITKIIEPEKVIPAVTKTMFQVELSQEELDLITYIVGHFNGRALQDLGFDFGPACSIYDAFNPLKMKHCDKRFTVTVST